MATKEALTRTLYRLTSDPGLPNPNPTTAYWQLPPSSLSNTQSPTLPSETDIVIIGSGITGCSVAKELLSLSPDTHITLLEARMITSGATGRNGGHVSTHPVLDYGGLVDVVGREEALRICKFRLRQFREMEGDLKDIGSGEGEGESALERSQIRRVEGVCGLADEETLERIKRYKEKFEGDWPEFKDRLRIYEKGNSEFEKFRMSGVVGLAVEQSGAVWPYRMITSIFSHLLKTYPHRFTIETLTPATSITSLSSSSEETPKYKYAIQTPRGIIKTNQIAYCTNAYTSYLLPSLRGKLIPVRGQMSVQRPGQKFPLPPPNPSTQTSTSTSNPISRSWSILWSSPGTGLDYITQSPQTHDLFYGGGLIRSQDGGLSALANVDDSTEDLFTKIHLNGALPIWFGAENWGKDSDEGERVRMSWSGVMGFTGDGLPLVGRLGGTLTGREGDGDGDGEWIAAGFNGYGMVGAWGCGKVLARLMCGKDAGEGFPGSYLVSEDRVERMRGEDVVSGLCGKIE